MYLLGGGRGGLGGINIKLSGNWGNAEKPNLTDEIHNLPGGLSSRWGCSLLENI